MTNGNRAATLDAEDGLARFRELFVRDAEVTAYLDGNSLGRPLTASVARVSDFIVALIELGRSEEAVGFAANELDRGQALADTLLSSIDEPVLTALLLGKSAQAGERGIELVLEIDPGLGDRGSPRATSSPSSAT
jgi:hypothetical protein